MNLKLPVVLLLYAFSVTPIFAQSIITTKSLLEEMVDYGVAAHIAHPSFVVKQASSYDRKSVNTNQPGWFANEDFNQFIRKEEHNKHVECVMLDADGPGAIVRFWLTTTVKTGSLRFYFDNEADPSIEIPAYDLMRAGWDLGPALLNPHSSYDPRGKGGNTLYLPMPYQKHCKITFEFTDTATLNTPHYYQINYRTYPPGTGVKTFTTGDLREYKRLIDSTERVLWQTPGFKQGKEISRLQPISPSGEWTVDLPKGANAIRLLDIQIKGLDKNNLEQALRSVILKIDFDGQQTVWCPVGDFSGSGFGGKMIQSWYRTLDAKGHIISRWVMPYRNTARLTIINRALFNVDVSISLRTDTWEWDSNSLYFHTSYRYGQNVRDAKADYDVNKIAAKDTAAPIEWNFVKIKGKGVYVGNTLSANNHMHAWYGEGDAKVWVDKDTFPSEFGTGLEDYYNTSWAPVVIYQTPFANAPRADNEDSYGYNTFTRTRNLDRIPFDKSFSYDLEMISWTGGTIDVAATVYWYGAYGAKDNCGPPVH